MRYTKRADLIKLLVGNGWFFLRNGAQHDIYSNGKDIEPIPRHREIKENLAKAIIKRRGLK
nr:MAG TPA: putative mRNA interferase toxin [Caudoviricetes sp.]